MSSQSNSAINTAPGGSQDPQMLPSGRALIGIFLVNQILRWFFGFLLENYLPDADYGYLVLVGAAGTAIVLFTALAFYPDVLKASRWQLSKIDVAVASTTALFLAALTFLLFGYSFTLTIHPVVVTSAVLLAPALEECVFRGIFLKSLATRFPSYRVLVVLGVGFISADYHLIFWHAFLLHSAFSAVYVLRKNSLSSSICCHFLFNVLVTSTI